MPRPKKKVAPKFTLSLTLGTKTFEGKGETLLEALTSMEKPVKIVSKGTLTIQHGENVRTLAMTLSRTRRLFYPLAQPILAKTMAYGL